jgi:L-lactate dehydrogenase complex protein LldG
MAPEETAMSAFAQEFAALGGKLFQAPDAAAARDYIERLVRERGGPAVAARRPAVEGLGLREVTWFTAGQSIAAVNIGITEADYALANTGTLVMFSQPGEGRALSLLPPIHVAVLEASRVLASLDQLLEREPDFPSKSSAMVLITGPSRTADIERTLTVGVHGPGELHVVLLP